MIGGTADTNPNRSGRILSICVFWSDPDPIFFLLETLDLDPKPFYVKVAPILSILLRNGFNFQCWMAHTRNV